MRNVVLAMMTTVNGRVDDPDAWLTDIGNDLYRDIDSRFAAEFDTILVGRTTYAEMVAYWPAAETEEVSLGGLVDAPPAAGEAAEINKRMAHKMNTYKKFVLSRGGPQEPLAWSNAELIIAPRDEDLVSFVRELKAQQGRNIHLAGGAQLAQSFVRLGLVDEIQLHVHPIASRGATIFDALSDKRALEFLGTTSYAGGVISVRYKPETTM
jgi:dihydrofolate reductase